MATAREITVPEAKPAFEWILGRAVQKVSPKRRRALLHAALVPDLAYLSYERETLTELFAVLDRPR